MTLRRSLTVAGIVAAVFGLAALLVPPLFPSIFGPTLGPAAFAFYDATAEEVRGAPGTLIRFERYGEPATSAWRILYRSTGLAGEPIAVSGVVVVPAGSPTGPLRDVVAWAHPTTGVVRSCAPSLTPGMVEGIPGIDAMLAQDYVVVATDYPGLGAEGTHAYLVGESEGRAVLDAVRAAHFLPDARSGERFVVWGHSQGGHAALFAGELAAGYAPELKLLGVAAAAPASELAALFEDDLNSTAGKILTALDLWSWSRVFGAPLDAILEPTATADFDRIAEKCITAFLDQISDLIEVQGLERHFLKSDLTKTEPWAGIVARNTAGQAPAGAPVFIAQGTADEVVDPPVTDKFVAELCRQGVPVRFLRVPQATHLAIAKKSAAEAVAWMAERFEGKPAPSDCGG